MNLSPEKEGHSTANDRQTHEMISRCVSTMVFFRGSHKSPKARDVLRDEAREVARWVVAAHLSSDELEQSLLEPVKRELIDRYGATIGTRLAIEFRGALDGSV